MILKIKKFLGRVYVRLFLELKHPHPAGILVHRKNGKVVFEIELNWFDENLIPVSIVREVQSGKIASIRYYEMKEFKEYAGSDPNAGNAI